SVTTKDAISLILAPEGTVTLTDMAPQITGTAGSEQISVPRPQASGAIDPPAQETGTRVSSLETRHQKAQLIWAGRIAIIQPSTHENSNGETITAYPGHDRNNERSDERELTQHSDGDDTNRDSDSSNGHAPTIPNDTGNTTNSQSKRIHLSNQAAGVIGATTAQSITSLVCFRPINHGTPVTGASSNMKASHIDLGATFKTATLRSVPYLPQVDPSLVRTHASDSGRVLYHKGDLRAINLHLNFLGQSEDTLRGHLELSVLLLNYTLYNMDEASPRPVNYLVRGRSRKPIYWTGNEPVSSKAKPCSWTPTPPNQQLSSAERTQVTRKREAYNIQLPFQSLYVFELEKRNLTVARLCRAARSTRCEDGRCEWVLLTFRGGVKPYNLYLGVIPAGGDKNTTVSNEQFWLATEDNDYGLFVDPYI
ncbi:17050_t:CDS:2, partial [Acaulospora colombiana]